MEEGNREESEMGEGRKRGEELGRGREEGGTGREEGTERRQKMETVGIERKGERDGRHER